jgi:hypothetical protein
MRKYSGEAAECSSKGLEAVILSVILVGPENLKFRASRRAYPREYENAMH